MRIQTTMQNKGRIRARIAKLEIGVHQIITRADSGTVTDFEARNLLRHACTLDAIIKDLKRGIA